MRAASHLAPHLASPLARSLLFAGDFAATAMSEQTPMEEADGLRRRKAAADTKHSQAMEDLWEDAASKMTSSQVDAAWERLLAETLPPEKQEALMRTYRAERDPRMRYNMLLEFSSYLRQGAAYGGNGGLAAPPKTSDDFRDGWDDDVGDGVSLKWEIARVLLIVGLVLGAVMGVAWWLGQMVDAQDVDEALG